MKKNLGFKIYRNRDIDDFHYDSVKEGILKNKKLFGRKPKNVNVFICDTEEEFKENSKYYYFPHAAGTCLRNGDVVIKSFEFLEYPEDFRNDYKDLVAHEINHSFWFKFYKEVKPFWLSEAIAVIVEGRHCKSDRDFFGIEETKERIMGAKLDESCLKYRYMARDIGTVEKVALFYSVWGYFADFISNKNPRKIVEFMDDYSVSPTRRDYENKFIKHFGKSLKDKFEDFLLD